LVWWNNDMTTVDAGREVDDAVEKEADKDEFRFVKRY
jgi:hypothetical protein